MHDTPLGQIVSIRSEVDPEILKHFTKEQRRIWEEWRGKVDQGQREQETEDMMDRLFAMALA